MSNELTKNDFGFLLKNNYKKIAIITFIFFVIGMGLSLMNIFSEDSQVSDSADIELERDTNLQELLEMDEDELSTEEAVIVNDYLNQGIHYFSLFVENENSSSFNRSNLLEEYLTQDDVVRDIESNLGYSIEPSPNHVIQVNFNSTNVLLEFYFRTGDLETSREIANEYYNYIVDENLPLLNNRYVYYLDEPQPYNLEDETEADEGEATSGNNRSALSVIISIILAIFVNLLLGFLIGVILTIIFTIFSKKISSIYNYEITEFDFIVNLLNVSEKDKQKVAHAIEYPSTHSKLVLSEDTKTLEKYSSAIRNSAHYSHENQQIEFAKSVSETDPKIKFDEIIILSSIGKTNKKWYRDQKNQLRVYHAPKKIIKLSL